MSLQPQAVYLAPEDTARVARAAFPKGNVYLRMHDELGRLYADQDFVALFPTRGQPALAPAQLALVTLMQFAEGLSDVRFVPSKPWVVFTRGGWGARKGGVLT